MVVEDLDVICAVFDLRRTYTDLHYFSLEVTDLNDVSHIIRFLKDYAQADQNICHDILCSKRYGQ